MTSESATGQPPKCGNEASWAGGQNAHFAVIGPRWKVENESFNTLKTKGYNLEHNFGHGKENLAAVLVTLNLIAFAYHTLAELTGDLWARAREKTGTRIAFFNHLRSITVFLVFGEGESDVLIGGLRRHHLSAYLGGLGGVEFGPEPVEDQRLERQTATSARASPNANGGRRSRLDYSGPFS